MKTRTFEVEVTTTSTVLVTLPEGYGSEETIKDWEKGLWPLPQGIPDIAEHAGRMAVYSPSANHDGVGLMITNRFEQPDYEKNKFQIVAITTSEDTESTVKEVVPVAAAV